MSLAAHLERLGRELDVEDRLAADPIAFPRRYAAAADQEVAGLVAALLAYGRVELFRPVIGAVLAVADARGGPRAFVDGFDPDLHGASLLPLVYRWNRGADFVLLFAALRRALRGRPIEALFAGDDVRSALTAAVEALRRAAVAEAGVGSFGELPRGLRTLLPSPEDGSACKRWNLYLRWMVRPADGVDLGLWRALSPRDLVVPLDTHVLRIGRFVGLTRRADASWRTAVEVTDALRALDPEDPVRFDFALAHLGISGACRGRFDAGICPSCALAPLCVEAAVNRPATRGGRPAAARR